MSCSNSKRGVSYSWRTLWQAGHDVHQRASDIEDFLDLEDLKILLFLSSSLLFGLIVAPSVVNSYQSNPVDIHQLVGKLLHISDKIPGNINRVCKSHGRVRRNR